MIARPRTQLAGIAAIRRALTERGDVRLLLVRAEDDSSELAALIATAAERGIDIWRGSPGDLRRMGRGPDAQQAVALLGPPLRASLPELLQRGGITWLLHRAGYPSNVGFAVRTAEVSGADGIIVDAQFNHEQRNRIDHVSMGASRLLPILYASTEETLAAAAQHGVRRIAIEDVGSVEPWQVDLRGPVVCVIGNEQTGIAPEHIAGCDASVRIPMAGFVPSYNVQAAMAAIASERLRQLAQPAVDHS
ncbi:MAG: TrmH family RNA methyltransferase [Polyangiales bacterium]